MRDLQRVEMRRLARNARRLEAELEQRNLEMLVRSVRLSWPGDAVITSSQIAYDHTTPRANAERTDGHLD